MVEQQQGKEESSPHCEYMRKKKLVDYVFKMQDLHHPLTPNELRLKVAIATHTRETP